MAPVVSAAAVGGVARRGNTERWRLSGRGDYYAFLAIRFHKLFVALGETAEALFGKSHGEIVQKVVHRQVADARGDRFGRVVE